MNQKSGFFASFMLTFCKINITILVITFLMRSSHFTIFWYILLQTFFERIVIFFIFLICKMGELLIIGLGSMIGYMMNQNKSKNHIPVQQIPNFPPQTKNDIDPIQRRLVEPPKKQSIYTDDGSASSKFYKNLERSVNEVRDYAAYDERGEIKRPFYKPENTTNQLYTPTTNANKNVELSALSGLPVTWSNSHINQQPFIKTPINQVENENAYGLLERYTGTPSAIPQGTYSQKREVAKPFPTNPENPFKAQISQLSDRYARAEINIKNTNNFVTPIKASRDLPFNPNTQILPPNIDQSRSQNSQKYSYAGRLTGGKGVSVRAMATTIPEPKKSLFHEFMPDTYVGNRSATTAISHVEIPKIRNVTRTQEYKVDYQAPGKQYVPGNAQTTQVNALSSRNNVNRVIETFTPHLMSGTSQVKGTKVGGDYQLKLPYKEYSTPNITGHFNNGNYTMTDDKPNVTLRDVTQVNNAVKNMNPSGFKTNDGYVKEINGLDVVPTMKELVSENKYLGQKHQDVGNGIRKQEFEPFVSGKETTMYDSSKTGMKTAFIPKHLSYETVYETGKDITPLSRLGAVEGNKSVLPTKGPSESVGQDDYEELFVKNYLNNPKSFIPNDTQRDIDYNDTYDPINFGDIKMHGKHTTGADDSKRMQELTTKVQVGSTYRTNPSLGRDNGHKQVSSEANLKNDSHTVSNNVGSNSRQPISDPVYHKSQTQTKDSTVDNHRLDPGLIVSNELRMTVDPYPWIKK